MIDADQFDELARQRDWASIDAMLDAARSGAKTREDLHSATHWRIAALKRQGRYTEALACLRENAPVYNCQSYVKHQAGRLLFRLGQETQALNEVKEAPLDLEVATFQAPVLEAKFFLFYLLARSGDSIISSRLAEIPDDHVYINPIIDDGQVEFLRKSDILDALAKG